MPWPVVDDGEHDDRSLVAPRLLDAHRHRARGVPHRVVDQVDRDPAQRVRVARRPWPAAVVGGAPAPARAGTRPRPARRSRRGAPARGGGAARSRPAGPARAGRRPAGRAARRRPARRRSAPASRPPGRAAPATSSCTRSDASGERSSCAASPTKVRCRLVAESIRSSIALRVIGQAVDLVLRAGHRQPLLGQPGRGDVRGAVPQRGDRAQRQRDHAVGRDAISSTASGPPMSAARVSTRWLSSTRLTSVNTRTVRVPTLRADHPQPGARTWGLAISMPRAVADLRRAGPGSSSELARSVPGEAASTDVVAASTTWTAVMPPVVGDERRRQRGRCGSAAAMSRAGLGRGLVEHPGQRVALQHEQQDGAGDRRRWRTARWRAGSAGPAATAGPTTAGASAPPVAARPIAVPTWARVRRRR